MNEGDSYGFAELRTVRYAAAPWVRITSRTAKIVLDEHERLRDEVDRLRLMEERALAIRDSSSEQGDVYNVGLNVAARLILGEGAS